MAARANLDAQAPIALEAGGQGAGETHGRETFGQHARQHFLARVTGNVETQARD